MRRCRNILRSKDCDASCMKKHKYPKDDYDKRQCHGEKWNFLHSNIKSEEKYNPMILETNPIGNSSKRLVSYSESDEFDTSSIEEKSVFNFSNSSLPSSKKREVSIVGVNEGVSLNVRKSEMLTSALPKAIKMEPITENGTYVTNRSSGDNSSTTAIITSTSLSEGTVNDYTTKRPVISVYQQYKKIKLENWSDVAIFARPIKIEQGADTLCKEEALDGMEFQTNFDKKNIPSANDRPSTSIAGNSNEALLSGRVISLPSNYKLADVSILESVTSFIMKVIDDLSTESDNSLIAENNYDKLCEYLQRQNIDLLCEVNHSRLLVWDVHIRYFFMHLLGVSCLDYYINIETILEVESFDVFISKIKDELNVIIKEN